MRIDGARAGDGGTRRRENGLRGWEARRGGAEVVVGGVLMMIVSGSSAMDTAVGG